MSEQNSAASASVNRAKPYQLMLFPLNNGATNVYYVLVLSYIATFGSKVLALSMIFASVMVTGMRLFDAITDPIIGALMDRTNGKFGKFRPFMVIGNLIMAVSILVLYCLTPLIPASMEWARYVAFVALYAIWVIGYTFQTSCTRSGQTVLTNDPKQRPLFTIFNTVGSLLGMGAMQFFAPILAKNYEGGYASAGFFRTLAPVGIVISIALTILAVIGIWEKDQPKYFGIGGQKTEKIKVAEYVAIIKGNNPMQRLMVAGAGCKLALSIATNTTVLCMLYGCMMGNYDGLYLPMMVLGYVFSVPFFLLTVRTSQKKGQKASLMRYVSVALICYIGVLVLLLLWGKGDAFTLSLMSDGKVSINVYTILFIALFGIGYGAYYATADMPIPMVADCSDYETYISGKYIPGIMGTLFSLVDKLVSSLSATVVGVAVSFIGKQILVDPARARLPSFTLQPVIENAFSHGLKACEEGGRILLRVWRQGRMLYVTVADNGKGMTEEELATLSEKMRQSEQTGKSIGLGNISRRVSMLYPDTGKMQVFSRAGHGTVIRFEIPQGEEEERA